MTIFFQWSPDLSVNVDKIDEQHQELFVRINGFLEAVLIGEGIEQLGGIIDFLLEYVDLHFRSEEYFMEQYQYPLYEAHKTEHERLTGEVMQVAQKIKVTQLGRDVVTGLITLMGNWIVEHVQKMDKNLGRYLESLGEKLDTQLPDSLGASMLRIESSEYSSANNNICDYFQTCSKMYNNFLDEEQRRFWINRFCRKSDGKEKCVRKREFDSGVQPEQVSRTMLPDGHHLAHLAGKDHLV
jgi:hemerythrin